MATLVGVQAVSYARCGVLLTRVRVRGRAHGTAAGGAVVRKDAASASGDGEAKVMLRAVATAVTVEAQPEMERLLCRRHGRSFPSACRWRSKQAIRAENQMGNEDRLWIAALAGLHCHRRLEDEDAHSCAGCTRRM